MEYKITSFIIAIVVASLFMATFANFMYETGANSGRSMDSETNETIENITKIEDVHKQTQKIEERHSSGNQSIDRSAYDVVGTIFADSLGTLKMIGNSISSFFGMANVGLETFKLNINFKLTLYSVIIVAIIIGVFVRVKLKQRI